MRPDFLRFNCAIAASVAVAAWTAGAAAQSRTLLDLQVSVDGRTWTNRVDLEVGGAATVQIRAVVSYASATSDQRPLGLAAINFQPTVSNWNVIHDRVQPFARSGENLTGGGVVDIPGTTTLFGRIIPFAMSGPSSSNPYAVHTQQVDGVSSMRLALRSAVEWPSPSAIENINGSDGIGCVQRAFGNLTARDPFFSTQVSGVVVFKYAVTIDTSSGARELQIDAPESSLSRNWQTGLREASWYSGLTDTYGRIKSEISVDGAAIRVIPGPFAAELATIMAIGTGLRRRRA